MSADQPTGSPGRRILVVLLAGAGDALMSTPFLVELERAEPDARVEVLVMQRGTSRPMLEALPAVDEVLFYDFQVEGAVRSFFFCLGLRSRRYDVSITPMPHNRFIYNFITFLIGARERWGFRYLSRGNLGSVLLSRRLKERRDLHLVENNLRLITEAMDRPLSDESPVLHLEPGNDSQERAQTWLAEHSLDDKKLIGVHPGSGATKNLWLKRFPPERWVQVIDELCSTAPRIGVVLLGGPEEEKLCHELGDAVSTSGAVVSAAGLPLLDTAALISRMSCLAASDTLMTHVGAAMGTPVVSIHGPTPATSTAPWATRFEIVRAGLPCSPCYIYSARGIRCRNPRKMACIEDIQPRQVVEAILRLAT
ncbi:MAG: glycosyltransferase family 9 protein [Thermoanaerobaculia bacterium]|nr:glycosyltransferase family 9 protein [Thermoanaerobaculia bacterium]